MLQKDQFAQKSCSIRSVLLRGTVQKDQFAQRNCSIRSVSIKRTVGAIQKFVSSELMSSGGARGGLGWAQPTRKEIPGAVSTYELELFDP